MLFGILESSGSFEVRIEVLQVILRELIELDLSKHGYPFEIKEDGEIVKAAMTNERIPEVPQTGDESNIGFWIGLAAVALGGVIATAIVLIKKKKDDENE